VVTIGTKKIGNQRNKMKQVHIIGRPWKYKVGRSHVKIINPGGVKYFVLKENVPHTGCFDREYAMVRWIIKPKDIIEYIEQYSGLV